MSETQDQLLIEFEQQERWRDMLGEVLAALNGDGGHYQTKHGAGRAAIDGLRTYYRLREHAEALATALEDADPPAFLSLDSGMYFECAYCQGASPDREQVPHSDDCEWLAIMTRVRAYRESNHG